MCTFGEEQIECQAKGIRRRDDGSSNRLNLQWLRRGWHTLPKPRAKNFAVFVKDAQQRQLKD